MLSEKVRKFYILLLAGLAASLFFVSGCKKSTNKVQSFYLQIEQSQISTQQSGSAETLDIKIQGEKVETVALDSIRMIGDKPSASPLQAKEAFLQDTYIVARFQRSGVLDILSSNDPGSSHTVQLTFYAGDDNSRHEVSARITVDDSTGGEGDTGSFTLEVEPGEWSLNYSGSSGTVVAFVRGTGLENLDLTSFELLGDNSSAQPLAAVSATLKGDKIHARFPKNQVLDLLSDPVKGSTHTITLRFLKTGDTTKLELSTDISIEDDSIIPSQLSLEIEPDEWSLNFAGSSGTIEAFIEGEGADNIDLNSIELTGDNPASQALNAVSATRNGDKIHARFPKNKVIQLLLNPTKGSSHTVAVSFLETGNSQRMELTATITIDDETIDITQLQLEIEPDEWDLNFSKSSGTVEAFIEGEGIRLIDLDSIRMEGDNPGASPLSASSAALNGDKIHARFPKNSVLALLANPVEGSKHVITISFLETGESQRLELTATITITQEDDDDIIPSTLSLDISPGSWNFNFKKSTGHINAFIRGEGLSNVDLNSIVMTGNAVGASLAAASATREGNHVKARFAKNKLFDLLASPTSGSQYTITVTFTASGQQYQLTDTIKVTGKDK